MDERQDLELELAQSRQRIAKLLDLEARLRLLEIQNESRDTFDDIKVIVSLPRWIAAYILFIMAMTLLYYDVRQWLEINVWLAMILGIIFFSVAGFFFVTGMGIVRDYE